MHRLKIDEAGAKWEKLDGMKEARSDMACEVVQYKWSVGIMVAGGYKLLGAWTSSVEFFDFGTGKWASTLHFPRMNEGRHNHGLTTVGMLPVVYGGWSNGAIRTAEKLDFCSNPPKWVIMKDFLLKAREKFATIRVPKSFAESCVNA